MTNPVSTSSDKTKSSLKRNMLFNTIGSLMYQGCQWLITVAVVLLSSNYENPGILAFAMATGNMFFSIGTYNIRTFQISDTNNEYSQADYIGFRFVTILIAWMAITPYLLLVSTTTTALIASIVFLLFKSDECLADVLYGVDQRQERMDVIGCSQFIRGLAVIFSFGGALYLQDSVSVAILSMFVACVVVTLAFDIPQARKLGAQKPVFDKAVITRLLYRCLPIAVTPLLTSMVVSIPRQYFSYRFSLEALGYYATIATPAVLIQAAARYMYAPLLVPLAQELERDGAQRFVKHVVRLLLIMMCIATLSVFLLSLGGRALLPLVFKGIADYLYLFPAVLCSTAAIAMFWFLCDILVICRDSTGQVLASGTAFAVAVSTMLPLESAFYMNGINWTIIISILLGVAVALYRLLRIYSSHDKIQASNGELG